MRGMPSGEWDMSIRLVVLFLAAATMICPGQIRVGVGKRVVTPDPLLPVSGGIGPGYPAEKKLGDLYARAMVLQRGETRVGFVAVDFLGFPSVLGDRVRRLVPEIPGDHLLIGASHTHSAPDCYGFPDEFGKPGCDMDYLDRVCRLAAEAVHEALEGLAPARLKVATGEARGQIAFNYYADELYDPRCSVIQAVGEGDEVIGTLVNYAIHPEVLGPKQGVVSPDVMGPLWERIEAETGGMAMFMNGALGGMVTADVRGEDGRHRQTWEECQRIGDLLGREALRIVNEAPFQEDPMLRCHTRRVSFPVENAALKQIIQLSPLNHPMGEDGRVTTQMNLVELGDARILTIPGEALPNIGYYLKRKLGGEQQLLFGLTNDAFGYLLTKVDWNSFERYAYITRTCLGEMTGEILMEEALAMVRQIDAEEEAWLSVSSSSSLLDEEVPGPWLGIGWQDLDALELSALPAPGVRVLDLAPDGPAEKAGVRAGDVVTHWNGEKVKGTAAALWDRVADLKLNEKVTLSILRKGKTHAIDVRVTDRTDYAWKAWRPDLPDFAPEFDVEGLFDDSAAELEEIKRQFEALEADLDDGEDGE